MGIAGNWISRHGSALYRDGFLRKIVFSMFWEKISSGKWSVIFYLVVELDLAPSGGFSSGLTGPKKALFCGKYDSVDRKMNCNDNVHVLKARTVRATFDSCQKLKQNISIEKVLFEGTNCQTDINDSCQKQPKMIE